MTGAESRRWIATAEPVSLPAGDALHVWRIDLGCAAADAIDGAGVLSDDEHRRAAALRFARDRRRFVAGRVALRRALAGYGGCPAAAVTFESSASGKPSAPACGVAFNVAHSGDLYLLAVRRTSRVGVDVEHVRPLDDLAGRAKTCLSTAERDALYALPPEQWPRGFWTAWTRKEAYLKAVGSGVTGGLQTFDVSVTPGSLPRVLADHDPARGNPSAWSLLDLPLGPDLLGVVAVDGAIDGVGLFDGTDLLRER